MTLTKNRLVHESSPYLLQHAHNPVDWYPWGEEAFQKAAEEDKPILVSIGYAACHWCHVMERESFEDEDTARLMNENFINIKVDREERPDIDHIYMDAVQAMTGSGGWPLNVFLTPGKQPFFGGTYFPPKAIYQRSSWQEVLMSVSKTYKEKKPDIESQAAQLTEYIFQSNQFGQQENNKAGGGIEKDLPEEILGNIMQQADTRNGGFGNAPKFPSTFVLQYLLAMYGVSKNEAALGHAVFSLDKMIGGGIYDHIGGGFARYATDSKWLVPHFEKMLYDNALLISTLSDAYKISQQALYKKVIRQTINYIKREMTDEAGAFFASQDADSEGVEGKYYTWLKKDIEEILGEEAAHFCEYYDITDEGNWEGVNILHTEKTLKEFAAEKKLPAAELEEKFDKQIGQLLAVRQKRVAPAKDTKIILSWNALMIIAYCDAYAALGDEDYKVAAVKNAAFIINKMSEQQAAPLYHVYKDGVAKHPAFLEDYALYIKALIRLQEITGDRQYLTLAKTLTDYTIQHFGDGENNYFYFTPDYQRDVIVRKKEIFDSALPSGNSVMSENLLYLSVLFNNQDYKQRAVKMAGSLAKTVEKYPTSFGVWASVLGKIINGLNEIAIVGPAAKELLKALLKHYIFAPVIMAAEDEDDHFPLLQRRKPGGETVIYLCRNYHCEAPVKDVGALLALMK